MFYKFVLFSALISSTLLSSSGQAVFGGELEVPQAKAMVHKLKKEPHDALEIKLATQLYNLWQYDVGGSFDQLIQFLNSSVFEFMLWREQDTRAAVGRLICAHSAMHDASSDLTAHQPQNVKWPILIGLFGENLPILQKALEQAQDSVINNCLLPSYKKLDDAKKARLLRRATCIKGYHSDAKRLERKLTRNLHSLFKGEFNGRRDKLFEFIQSNEFVNFLKQHPHRRDAFNRIALEKSALSRGCGDLRNIEQIPESQLYATLVRYFGEHLPYLQAKLVSSLRKAFQQTDMD